ncbi:TetR/AcrR family transcriptional regulator [Paracoccus zhejiangensis]|uniref:TetR family transcriptional regulator n=1 Tax=Paracoccus zhejiangensis TaxID=1077935 RepID=A0A2H5EVI8_9RHOB|nr:TetR/AcrR family transcriptional regulator [Paracoccus zhejiangensis]AUH63293.1 TetR family transcriptional regulator [Paracoccus zhejiangensis]
MPTPTTRELIVEQADALFYEGGYEATSFAEIAAALGISRGNFYHHFKTKDDILDAVITRRVEKTRVLLDGWQAEAIDPRARILSFIRLVIANRAKIMAFGCPVGTLASELAKLDHAAQDRAAEIFGLFRDWLACQFRALGAGERSEALALHLLVWSQGVAVMASALRDETIIHREVEGIEHWLATLTDLAPAQ